MIRCLLKISVRNTTKIFNKPKEEHIMGKDIAKNKKPGNFTKKHREPRAKRKVARKEARRMRKLNSRVA